MNALFPDPTEDWEGKFTSLVTELRRLRTDDAAPFEIFDGGYTPGDDPAAAARLGATWWVESLDPSRFGWDGSARWPEIGPVRDRIRQGPPR
jgi:hypothetical protein